MSHPEQLGSTRMADAKEFQVPQAIKGAKAFLCAPLPPPCRPPCAPCVPR